ncbi:MAG: 2'-deoxycytidine 5'-triphosphate deaminase [Planctomycetes bacterium]|nr:2'-deoxycytidine 5'-triphosphate deaminase [Planctomycetota bacterium]MCB9868557.1 2'-deoxycytidine 5'-triphosphate deaminase [Planctomycetota bacterium]
MDGILVYQQIRDLVASGCLSSNPAISPAQIQPSSLDLRLATRGYRVRSGFLPERCSVSERLEETTLYAFDLTDGAILEKGNCYVIPLLEQIVEPLPYEIRANPKSSTGRLDLFTRVLVDHHGRFEQVPPGYVGPMFLEVVPRSFPVRVRTGLSLCQIRFSTGHAVLTDDELRAEYARRPLLLDDHGAPIPLDQARIDNGLCMGVAIQRDLDLRSHIGFVARRYTGVLDMAADNQHEHHEFFELIHEPVNHRYIVEPEEFYIFASKERIRVPRHLAAEMAPYEIGIAELRTNYAGFFDNGFGGEHGTRAVLEVRPHDVPFLVEDGQVFFKLRFFKTSEAPQVAYGDAKLESHYQGQGLKLSKHFRQGSEAEASRGD